MEREKRNQTASFLMVVGIIFIVVAGTIFVSTTWRYLPAAGKQGLLFLGTVCLFLASSRMEKGGLLNKTEAALYYLATSCLGLFALSVCGEFMGTAGKIGSFYGTKGWNAEAILITSVIMFLPVILRFVKKRTAFDFVMMALLVDWILLWIRIAGEYEWFGGCVIAAVSLTAYALADYLNDRWMGKDNHVELAFMVLYILHGIHFIACNLTLFWIDDALTFQLSLFVMALFMTGLTVLMQMTRRYWIVRVFNSMAIYWCIITGMALIRELVESYVLQGQPWSGEMEHFIVFSLCALCMFLFARKEMIVVTVVWGMLIPFIQIWSYGPILSYLFGGTHQASPYVPFSGVLILTVGLLIYRKNLELSDEQMWGYIYAAVMQGIVMLVVFYASKYPFLEKGTYALLTLQSLTAAFCFCNKVLKGVFRTGALFFGEILLFISSHDIFFHKYEVERLCLLAAAGTFLLSVIWNNYGLLMRSCQFAVMCLIMTIMLGNAMLEGEVGNALILGITGVIILVCSAVFNSRRYAVLSSVILILLALYLSRNFWSSIAWWVYLFVAGVVLVVLAMRKERASNSI